MFGNTAMNQNTKAVGGFGFNTGAFNSGVANNTNTLGFGLNNNANNGVNKPLGFGGLGIGGATNTLGGNNMMMGGGSNMMMGGGGMAGGIGDNNIANLIKALTDNPFGHSSLLKTPLATTGELMLRF